MKQALLNKMKNELGPFLCYLESVCLFSKHTIRNYKSDIEDFFSNLVDDRLDGYIAYLYDKGLNKKTIARKFASLRSFGKFLKKRGVVKNSFIDNLINPRQEKTIPNILTIQDIDLLLSAPDLDNYLGVRDRCIMELLYSCGIRAFELVSLDRDDIDFSKSILKVVGKGSRQRMIPITQIALQNLDFYLNHTLREVDTNKHKRSREKKAVFLNRFGERITTRSIQRIFTYYKMKIGFAVKLTPHIIRHSFATHLLESGLNLKSIQKLLGHRNLQSTTIYTNVSMSLKQKAYKKAHPLENKVSSKD